MGPISLAAFAKPLVAGAMVLACLCDAPPEDIEGELRKAAQHFANLEDDEAKTILDELVWFDVVEAKVLLGYLYADPLYPGRDYEKAIVAFEEAAASGSDEALFQVAESRFWPDYSNWPLTPDEKALRPTAEDVFGLLQRISGEKEPPFEGHNAAKWRLAWLCTFGGYHCGERFTDEAVKVASAIGFDNLRAITVAYDIMELERSVDTPSPDDLETVKNYISIGIAHADPFVASLVTDTSWRDVSEFAACPEADNIDAAARLLALTNDTAARFENRLDFGDCYDDQQTAEIERKLGVVLDQAVRTYGYENSWAQRWCYENLKWPAIGRCLITTVRDHFFACTKLSLPRYFNERFAIEYRESERYRQCRSLMFSRSQLPHRS